MQYFVSFTWYLRWCWWLCWNMYSCVFLRLHNLYNRELGTSTLPGHPYTFNIHSFYQSTTHNTKPNQTKPNQTIANHRKLCQTKPNGVNLAPTTFSQSTTHPQSMMSQIGTVPGTCISNWYWYLKLVPYLILVSQTGAVPGTGVSNWYWYLKLILAAETVSAGCFLNFAPNVLYCFCIWYEILHQRMN